MKKIMLFVLLIGLLALGFKIFYKKGKSIERLDHRELKFIELPKKIQQVLADISNNRRSLGDGSLMVLDSNKKYKIISVETGPWVDYKLLEDIDNKKQYRAKRGTPYPYIIYKNKLYIPKDYNVVGANSQDIYTSLYNEYVLE